MLTRRRDQKKGFTLIEVMVVLVILGLLLTQAMPSFTAWMANLQIRNSAEAILNGLQLARAQAVRSNVNTQLVLTSSDPVIGNVNSAVASLSGANWIIRNFQPTGTYSSADFVQGRSGKEGSRQALIVADQSSFIFTPLGRLLNPPAATVNINISNGASYTNKRPMRILVSPGGQVLMCDPNKVDPTNPQFCP